MVAAERSAPAISSGSRWRSAGSSAAIPVRMPTKASRAIGTLMSRRTCQGATASTTPPTVGPTASPTSPTVEMSVIARTRRLSTSNSRKASAMEPGVEHYPAATESIGDRAEQQHETPEHDAVAAGHPLQGRRRGVEVAADRGERDVEDRVVEHLEEEDGGEAAEGHP